jgi:putative ABC transport system ATP-binding protein
VSLASSPLISAQQIALMGDPDPIRRITLEIREGDGLALCGPSGCGKTLLLRAMAMLDPILSGSVLWKGEEVPGERIPQYRASVLYLPQRVALVESTVEVALGAFFSFRVHRTKKFERGRAEELLDMLGRNRAFLSKECRNLSGGERQIVALIRALLLEPEILLLDEPTAALDAPTAEAVEALVLRESRTYVWVTHQEGQAARVGRQRLELRAGLSSSDGSNELQAEARNRDCRSPRGESRS